MRLLFQLCVLVVAMLAQPVSGQTSGQAFVERELPALPGDEPRGAGLLGVHGTTLLYAGAAGEVLALQPDADRWRRVGDLGSASSAARAACSTPAGVLVITAGHEGADAQAILLSWKDERLNTRALPAPPARFERGAAATATGNVAYLFDADPPGLLSIDVSADAPAWRAHPGLPAGAAVRWPAMVALGEALYLFGKSGESPVTFRYQPARGWTAGTAPPRWQDGAADAAVPYGHAHVLVFAAAAGNEVPVYHAITDTWLSMALEHPVSNDDRVLAVNRGKQAVLVAGRRVLSVEPRPVKTNYGWLDHAVVAVYLVGMIAMGWRFAGGKKDTQDYFRGGRRIPWWATGMSLFATGASAISLMSMPGKAYATDWTYFSISIFSLVALPISLQFLAPLVRRLNIATSNEYLERRFGVTARLFASSIYCFTQVFGRMAPVLLLPSIALSAITGIEITTSVLIMGLITTVYTFLGGLEAVVWTDTVQGLIMCAAVAGCLLLALIKLSMGADAIWQAAASAEKLHVFDWSFDMVRPVAWVFLVSTVVFMLGGIGDQNFVQRVQCTPTLRDAKRAVAMQLAVAIPINVLLFALGTALWLFYRSRPEQLSATMETDGIFPFFVAQQLPPGASGLVVAALLAATMSTISSSICAVADLGVNDFYRRFSARASERSAYVLGRVLMAGVGVVGTGVAILLGKLGAASVWDLALLVTGLISNGIIGLFWVGLLTRRANQPGALAGVVCGMLTVVFLQQRTSIHFLWYQAIGAAVTIVTGYFLSLVLPARQRDLSGLTVFTLGRTHPDEGAATTRRPLAGAS